MSDSDDTDVLLLIPPNFFLVPSDQESESELERNTERIIFGNLITHVQDLENRVNHIETLNYSTTSLSEFDNKTIESEEPNYLVSSDFNINCANLESPVSFCTQPNFTESNGVELLNEIDQFIDQRQIGKAMDNISTIDTLFQNGSPTKRLALPEVDKLLKEMEATQTEIENKLRMRENEHLMNKHQIEVMSRKAYSLGDNIGSIPDRGFGLRDHYSGNVQNSPIKSNNDGHLAAEELCVKRDAFLVGSSNTDDIKKSHTSSLTLSRSPLKEFTTPPKATPVVGSQEPRRKSYLSPRRRLQMCSDMANSKSSPSSKPLSEPRIDLLDARLRLDGGGGGDSQEGRLKPDGYSSKMSNARNQLLSLAELWRNENDVNTEDPSKLKQKLEEEKYRRFHLENTVQTLQRRVLEEQEKVAVALRVDEAKDRAIGQVTEAWKQMVQHWRQIEKERHAMSQTLILEKSEIAKQKEDLEKKISRWEKEKSQALDLAAGYKAKYEDIEKEFNSTRSATEQRTKELEDSLMKKEEFIQELKEERKSLGDRLQMTKQEHEDEKRLVESLRRDVSMLQEQLSKSEAELIVVKEQRDLLTTRLREEKGRSSMLDAQKQALTEALDAANEKLNKTEEEVKAATSSLEKSKIELRTIYQSQLETVVREKVAEFQSQLDRAQAYWQAELENSKRQAEEMAHRQQQALINSHVVEMRRLESIHKDELKGIEIKLADSERRRIRLENGKKEIAQRLHGVMESQWRQALNIITSELSFKQNESGRTSSRIQHPEDHYLKGGGINKLIQDSGGPSNHMHYTNAEFSKVKATGNDAAHTVGESETGDDIPFNKDGQITSRSNAPLTKQPQLLNYIQMLLERQPGKPVDSTCSSVNGGGVWGPDTTEDTAEEHSQHWAQIIQNNPTILKEVYQNPDDLKLSQNVNSHKKPPWKPS